MKLLCDWTDGDKHCTMGPRYLCNNSHVLCSGHTLNVTRSNKRRSTDRFCGLCFTGEMTDFRSDSHLIERRRREIDKPEAVRAAEAAMAKQIVARMRDAVPV